MRSDNIKMLEDTLDIIAKGKYKVKNKEVKLKLSPRDMEEVKVLLPDDVKEICGRTDFRKIHVVGRCAHDCLNMDSFSAAIKQYKSISYRLSNVTKPVLVLNLANPVSPGGGVRRGAKAQEEDLCRKSSLLVSLESKEAEKYYKYNKKLRTNMGSDALIFSPKVEIIKDENGELLDETVVVSVLTCAAPMVTYGKEGMSEEAYQDMVYNRIMGMLKCAAYYGYKYLVLGAWGCGAFGNDAHVISDLFYKALKEMEYNGLQEKDFFNRIEFAVLDKTKDKYNFKEFYRNFDCENFYREDNQEIDKEVAENKKKAEVYLDKIRGSLYGGAIGDALGYPVEFMTEKDIFATYGKKGITDYELDRGSKKALVSDDTQMTLFTANGILVGETRLKLRGIGGIPHIYMPKAYQDWLSTQEMSYKQYKSKFSKEYDRASWLMDVPELFSRRAPGNTCLSALYKQRKEKDVEDFIRVPQNDSKGCGGVMRVAPLAMKNFYKNDMEGLQREAAHLAAITHGHSLGYMTASVLVHIINRIIYSTEKLSLKEIVLEARDTVSKVFVGDKHIKELTDIIELAISLSENGCSDIDNIHKLGEGWIAEETLAIAIYCSLRYKDDYSAGIIAAVNHNGDSDSTGAVTGNILGALVGYEAIEDKWKKDLEMSDVILEMSDDMCYGCQLSEYSSYKDKDWSRKYIQMKWKDE